MIEALPIREIEDRDSLLASVGESAAENECMLSVTEGKILHAFLLFVFTEAGGRITRVLTFPGASDEALDLGLRAAVNIFDRAGAGFAYYDPKTEHLSALARAVGFVPAEGAVSDLKLDIAAFFAAPCHGH